MAFAPLFQENETLIPFTFEELQKILELKADEIDTDLLIFNATLSYVETYLVISWMIRTTMNYRQSKIAKYSLTMKTFLK